MGLISMLSEKRAQATAPKPTQITPTKSEVSNTGNNTQIHTSTETLDAPKNIAGTPMIINALPQYDILGEINKAKDARIASRTAALQDVLNKAKSNISAEKATIAPQYYDLRNQESTSAQMRAKRVGELMAQKGYSEGYQGQAEIGRNVAYQGNIGALKRQEQSAYDDIARRETAAKNEYNTGIAQAQADADTWGSEQRLNELGTLRNYGREDKQNEQTRNDNAYLQQGLTYDPKTGGYVKTSNQNQLERENKIVDEDRMKTEYANSIKGLGDSFDYQAEINKIASDNDTSNDWKIPMLKQERQLKIDTKVKNEIATIDQYSDDYMSEINRRKSINPNDPLLPYLTIARNQKISNQDTARAKAFKEDLANAYKNLEQFGYVTSQYDADLLGVPVGTTSQDYMYKMGQLQNDTLKTQYDINKPYYNPNTGSNGSKLSEADKKVMREADLNKSFGEDYRELKGKSYDDAEAELRDGADAYIAAYGTDGYKQLWNMVLSDAIAEGAANAME